jgi:hypothetical protein
MKRKIIEFGHEFKYINIPEPAKNFVPDWYKQAEMFIGGQPHIAPMSDGSGVKTIKTCGPFLDSFISGYMICLTQDIEVINNNGSKEIYWAESPTPVEDRNSELLQKMPVPVGYSEKPFAWKSPYSFRTPEGFSLIFGHPLNRFDLPFFTLTGIVDSDNGINAGNIPFFIKEDFEGIIKMGTPIAQLIPFKRDDWKAIDNSEELNELNKKLNYFSNRVVKGWYKKLIRKNKSYI